jgi:hypothetical protein
MCPLCIVTAALIAGSATSTGGLTALVVKKFGGNKPANRTFAPAEAPYKAKQP